MLQFIKKTFIHETFESVTFWGVLFFCFMASIASAIFTAMEDLGKVAAIYTAFITFYFVILAIVAQMTKKHQACYSAMCFALNTLILPPMFFICGGLNSGMPFYCITSLLITSLISNFRTRVIMAIYSLILYTSILFYDWYNPELSPPLEPFDTILDQVVSFVFMALLIFTTVSYLLKAYHLERQKKDEVIAKLDYLSTHDPLTGLFNRRIFIERIRNQVLSSPAGYYLLMFDIDYFKQINDTYGHLFGDQVLESIGQLAKNICNREGEMAVRYGGEEFILLICEDNYTSAMAKAEDFRKRVSAIKFEDQPNVSINISGGFIDCYNPNFSNYDKILTVVDERLYTAKSNGRNQIIGKY
ncbi:diguanylate cyclase (GGDEF) domain-containing protein [Fibrobacter sp. UWH5]|uniref:GGDEF domain-containing protein n=1 Tax=Fibrobacter sp. UWH5 TaxID=1896211 RepID=UPI00091D8834|nr:GGDEF domain-containing protein [Fibrobacter sp. UWH5]SHL12615.1 diguanylate cyclase (GGDEF) domain-containing protein [Fibrobacter sp. UWH5]